MLKDTNLSTILLLGVLLFLIYCLMNQSKQKSVSEQEIVKDFRVTKKSDEYDNFANSDSEEQELEMDPEFESNDVENFEEIDHNGITGVNASDNENFASPVENFADSEVSPEIINQIASESNKRTVPVNSALLQSSIQTEKVNQFAPSDDSASSGAGLDVAFERPVADTTNTDVIDLQKNNVKNYNAKDYLPKEINDDWFNTDFSQAKYKMNDDKLINTDKYIIGINTVGQSLKNASYDIRGAINVPKYSVSPWNNSTIEPDYNIKPLC